MSKKTFKRLSKIVNDTYINLTDKIIFCTENAYVMYNNYAIVRGDNGITVHRKRDEKEFSFGKMKHAVTWAILDHNDKMYEADRVVFLDLALDAIEVDKKIHEKLKKQGKLDQYTIYTNKLQKDIERQKRFVNEIDKYITTADLCHQRGIRNELNGTSRKQEKSNTTRFA